MKVFSQRPGVELLEICGEYLLVATKEARDTCPYVTQINESAAIYWKLLKPRSTVNELSKRAAEYFGKETKDVLIPIVFFADKMNKNGYLVEEEIE